MKHMTIKKCIGVTAAAMLLTPAALADTADSALVRGGALNLRQTPSMSAKVLGQFPTGTLVEIVEAGSEWHKVEVDGQTGYMLAKFLNTGMGQTAATVRTNSGIGLNLRETPDMGGRIITSAPNKSAVTVLQRGKDWCRVSYNGQEGFMSAEFLTFTQTSTVSGKVAVVNNSRDTQVLNLRQTASLEAKVLGHYRNGAKVTILSAGDTWHKVQTADGKVGYMMAKYLRETDETAPMQPYQAKAINANGGSYVNLRKGASLNAGVIRRIPVGSAVTVTEHGTDWCKVTVDGQEGYMSTWFLAVQKN